MRRVRVAAHEPRTSRNARASRVAPSNDLLYDPAAMSSKPGSGRPVVLAIDRDPRIRTALEKELSELGYAPETAGTLVPSRLEDTQPDLVVLDLDTPAPGQGTALLEKLRVEWPRVPLLVLITQPSFEAAVAAFRAGASDVFVKRPDEIASLRKRMRALVEERISPRMVSAEGDAHAAVSLCEELLERLVETSRGLLEHEDRASGRMRPSEPAPACGVIVVDPDLELFVALEAGLTTADGWQLRHVRTGGEALDAAGNVSFDLAVVSDNLPDLPGRTVARTLRQVSPATLAILYTPAAKTPGRAVVVEASKDLPLAADLLGPSDLVSSFPELREARRALTQEHRVLRMVKQRHGDVLKQLAALRRKGLGSR